MKKPNHIGAPRARRTVLWAGFALALALTGAGAASAEEAKVVIDNFTFGPAALTVKVGTTVKWENHDDIPHSVVDKNKAFRSPALDTNESYTFTFTSAGTYDYFCGLHPHMVGKIIVQP
jgi:amicyanin